MEHFKEGGPGYQSRINDILRAYLTSKRLEVRTWSSLPGASTAVRSRRAIASSFLKDCPEVVVIPSGSETLVFDADR